ncbi:hypothetical protein Tco_0733161 [Tanacetum coccineum]
MKDLGSAKQILGLAIIKDKTKEARYQPLGDQFKLNKKQEPKTGADRGIMAKVSYASAVGKAVKWLLRYLKGTSKATLYFSRKNVVLEGFSDSDYGGCLDTGKSTIEAEYMAIAEAGKELVWLKNFLRVRKSPDRDEEDLIFDEDSRSTRADMFIKVVTTREVEALRNFNWL